GTCSGVCRPRGPPRAAPFEEDSAFLVGNGVGKPLGVLHADNAAAVTVAKESGQPADTIVWENVIKMFSRMLPASLQRAVWIANIECFPELATMALSVGTGGSAVWLADGVATAPTSILGRPLIFTEHAAPLGDVGDLSLVDLSHYIVADRQAMTVMSSEHFRFNTDQTAYRVLQRMDARPGLLSPLQPRQGTNTLSPFVLLGARA
ncbi:MAG: phage major capsid protein, partial [Actinomycetia bacterium]|nr:phage major capsid protein [Actinomycetes bacterium]